MAGMRDTTDAKLASKFLPHLAAFAAVVDAGSFTRAARRSGVDKTLLSRRVIALERMLGTALLRRTTRRVRVTLAGEDLYARAASPLEQALAALSRARGPESIEGIVRIATFSALTDGLWSPILADLRRTHPRLSLDLRASDQIADLVDGGIDFALRTGRLADSTMKAARIGSWRYVLCATPAWLKAHRREIRTPEDLKSHWLLYTRVPRAAHWRFESGDRQVEVTMSPIATSDNTNVVASLLRAGMGVTAIAPYAVADSLRRGDLVRVLPKWRVAHSHPLWLVTPIRELMPARVRFVMDAVRARIPDLEAAWTRLSG
jgi:DNA-binding transcriptional LysR family regulator